MPNICPHPIILSRRIGLLVLCCDAFIGVPEVTVVHCLFLQGLVRTPLRLSVSTQMRLHMDLPAFSPKVRDGANQPLFVKITNKQKNSKFRQTNLFKSQVTLLAGPRTQRSCLTTPAASQRALWSVRCRSTGGFCWTLTRIIFKYTIHTTIKTKLWD